MDTFSEEVVNEAERIHATIINEVLYAKLPKKKADEIINEIGYRLDDAIADL